MEYVIFAKITCKKKINSQHFSYYLQSNIEIIKQRGATAKYDCVVAVSGGMDSTYLLYLLTSKYNLRCLAAYYRTPFTPPEIDKNIKKIAHFLNVPLIEMDISEQYHRQVTSYFVRMWKDNHDQIIINLACAVCKFVNKDIYRIAKRYGIRSIVHGINDHEYVHIAAGQLKNNKRDSYTFSTNFLKLLVISLRGIKILFKYPRVARYLWLAFQSSILYISPCTVFLRFRYPYVKVINYFHNMKWDEQEAIDTLNSLGWKIPEGFVSPRKADCYFAHLKNEMTSLTSGADYFDSIYSNMVRHGILERDAALKKLEQEGKPSKFVIKEALRIIGLSNENIV